MRNYYLLVFLFLALWPVQAQVDSLHYKQKPNKFQTGLDKMTTSRLYQMTYAGVPLVVAGLIVKSEDDHFRQLRNDYLPRFDERFDDYIQYLPAAVMLGLKIGGVEGRSSWARMIVSDAFSAALMGGVVLSLKETTNVRRPDGSNDKSFPSGHTATAFMTATMLSKEYGCRSPWYSIGAYTAATATGFGRMANNKHWLSDVLVGAGIGILTTELGYFLADLIFKEKGIRHFSNKDGNYKTEKPSFFGVRLGFDKMPGNYRLAGGETISLLSGANGALEGAYFFNSLLGVGAEFNASNLTVVLDDEVLNKSLSYVGIKAGPVFSYPLATQILVGGKAMVNWSRFFKESLTDQITIGNRSGFGVGGGVYTTVFPDDQLGVKFFFDYNMLHPFVDSNKSFTHVWTLGGSVSVMF